MQYGSNPPPGGPRRLLRSSRERMWAGVAGGLGEYFDVDPVVMRVIWVAAAVLTGGLAVPAYLALWVIMPRDDQANPLWRPATPTPPPFDPSAPEGAGAPPSAVGQPVGAGAPDASFRSPTDAETELLRPVVPPPLERVEPDDAGGRRGRAAGILLIALGALFFAQQIGLFRLVRWDLVWPLLLIAVGGYLLLRQDSWRR